MYWFSLQITTRDRATSSSNYVDPHSFDLYYFNDDEIVAHKNGDPSYENWQIKDHWRTITAILFCQADDAVLLLSAHCFLSLHECVLANLCMDLQTPQTSTLSPINFGYLLADMFSWSHCFEEGYRCLGLRRQIGIVLSRQRSQHEVKATVCSRGSRSELAMSRTLNDCCFKKKSWFEIKMTARICEMSAILIFRWCNRRNWVERQKSSSRTTMNDLKVVPPMQELSTNKSQANIANCE